MPQCTTCAHVQTCTAHYVSVTLAWCSAQVCSWLNTSTSNIHIVFQYHIHFVFACNVCILFSFRCKPNLKLCIHKRTKWFANRSHMVCEPSAHMCGWDCKPVLAIRKRFAYRNLLIFSANTKRTGCVRCPFHTPNVLCLSQVRKKLTNRGPNTCCTQMQRVSCTLISNGKYRRK